MVLQLRMIPLKIFIRVQQNNIIYLFLRNENLIKSTYSKFKQFNVHPLQLLVKQKSYNVLYKKIKFFLN
jgi:hypothetical protein